MQKAEAVSFARQASTPLHRDCRLLGVFPSCFGYGKAQSHRVRDSERAFPCDGATSGRMDTTCSSAPTPALAALHTSVSCLTCVFLNSY